MPRLDGLRRQRTIRSGLPPIRVKSAGSRQRLWPLVVVVAILFTILGLSIQPIFAAFPFPNVQADLQALRLLRPGTYLVLFQNPRELRPTGGFLGSFAEVDVGWGLHIKHIQVETNIYARDAAYATTQTLDAPQPVAAFLGGNPWALRDSNWALDFPEAAQTIAWFYNHEGGRPVTGVIATDARLLERLVRLTGPLTLPSGTQVTADQVVDQLETEVEKTYWQDPTHVTENQPKAVLAALLPQLLSRLKRQPLTLLLQTIEAAFATKEILVFSRDPQLAQVLKTMDWDGHLLGETSDYLYVNEANLTPVDGRVRTVGAKSSWSIDRTLALQRTTENQTTTHQLTLTRHHGGKNVWPDGPNQSFLRIAVPAGATLLEATRDGVPITSEIRLSSEGGKTVFGLWSHLQPGDQETLQLTYQTIGSAGPLVIQRQPGMPSYPVTLAKDQTLVFQGDLNEDLFLNP